MMGFRGVARQRLIYGLDILFRIPARLSGLVLALGWRRAWA